MQQLLTCGGDSMAYNRDDNLPCDLSDSRSAIWTVLEHDMQWRTCLQARAHDAAVATYLDVPGHGPWQVLWPVMAAPLRDGLDRAVCMPRWTFFAFRGSSILLDFDIAERERAACTFGSRNTP